MRALLIIAMGRADRRAAGQSHPDPGDPDTGSQDPTTPEAAAPVLSVLSMGEPALVRALMVLVVC
jgi:hypothetical protein